MKKRSPILILLIVLIAALSLTFAGCNFSDNDDPPTDENTDGQGNADVVEDEDGVETDEEYFVTFDTGTDQTIAKISVTYGKSYALPTPVRSGYGFTGWYDGETEVKSSGTWTIQSDVTLTAKWERQTAGISYALTEDKSGYVVDKYSGEDGVVYIASTYLNKPVVAIGDFAFYNCRTLSEVNIQGDVKSIGEYAFARCDGISDIALPDSVETVGEYAFENCTALNKVAVSENLTDIGTGAFKGCGNLYSFALPLKLTAIGENAFLGCNKLVEVVNLSRLDIAAGSTDFGMVAYYAKQVVSDTEQNNFTDKDGYVFYDYNGKYYLIAYNGGETDLALPEDINGSAYSVNQGAFYATPVVSVTISAGVEELEESAFADCTELGSVEFSANARLSRIGRNAFSGCEKLTDITLPAEVTGIEENAFDGCAALTAVDFAASDKLIRIGAYAFRDCVELREITLPDSLSQIGVYAFDGCAALQNVSLPNKVSTISAGLFSGCGKLAGVQIPDGVKTIGDYAFADCGIVEIELPETVTSIGRYAFRDCINLENIVIPGGVTVINDYTFSGCKALPSITLHDGIGEIGIYAFDNCSALQEISIPGSVYSIGDYAFNRCAALSGVTFGANIVLREIGDYVFGYCYALENVSIPNTVQSINKGAFTNTGLTSVFIPSAVEAISDSAFSNCSRLENVIVASNSALKSIERYAFSDCPALTEIVIPNKLESVGANAFRFCRSLDTVYFEGGYYDWDKVDISLTENSALTEAKRYYYYSEKPSVGDGWHYDEQGMPALW